MSERWAADDRHRFQKFADQKPPREGLFCGLGFLLHLPLLGDRLSDISVTFQLLQWLGCKTYCPGTGFHRSVAKLSARFAFGDPRELHNGSEHTSILIGTGHGL
jgi:hypothetical protein